MVLLGARSREAGYASFASGRGRASTLSVFPTRRRREERAIALGRVLLLGLSSVAFVGPFAPEAVPPAWLIEPLYVYLGLAATYALLVWNARVLPHWLIVATHALDLGCFTALAFARDGTASPLFVVVVFALVTATVRWQWRGIAWTGAISLLIYLSAGAWTVLVVEDPQFDRHRFLVRVASLIVLTMTLGLLGRYYRARLVDLENLSRWPRGTPDTLEGLLEEVLPHVASMLEAPEISFRWQTDGDARERVTVWSGGRLAPAPAEGVSSAIVPAGLAEDVFLWSAKGGGTALFETGGKFQQVAGIALPTGLVSMVGLGNAVVLPIAASGLTGLLVAHTKRPPKPDRIDLGRLIAKLFSGQINQTALERGLRQQALDRERARMARDIHDGVAQSLAVANLRLRAAGESLVSETDKARSLIAEAEELLVDGQGELRSVTESLSGAGEEDSLEARLRMISRVVERSYGIPVRLELDPSTPPNSGELVREASHLVREAANNAARHAGAREIKIALEARASALRIRIQDNGHGLAFEGRRDLAALIANDEGPRAIRDRVRDLAGALTIDSSPAGTLLDISLPLHRGAA